jgi:hypothetical protein
MVCVAHHVPLSSTRDTTISPTSPQTLWQRASSSMNLIYACNFIYSFIIKWSRRMLRFAQRTIFGALRYSSPNTTGGFYDFTQYSNSLGASFISIGGFVRPHHASDTRHPLYSRTGDCIVPASEVSFRTEAWVLLLQRLFRDDDVSYDPQITSYVLFLLCSTWLTPVTHFCASLLPWF